MTCSSWWHQIEFSMGAGDGLSDGILISNVCPICGEAFKITAPPVRNEGAEIDRLRSELAQERARAESAQKRLSESQDKIAMLETNASLVGQLVRNAMKSGHVCDLHGEGEDGNCHGCLLVGEKGKKVMMYWPKSKKSKKKKNRRGKA